VNAVPAISLGISTLAGRRKFIDSYMQWANFARRPEADAPKGKLKDRVAEALKELTDCHKAIEQAEDKVDNLGWGCLRYCKRSAYKEATQELKDSKKALKAIKEDIKSRNLFELSRYRESVRRDMTTEALAKDRMSKEKLYIKAQEALRVIQERDWAADTSVQMQLLQDARKEALDAIYKHDRNELRASVVDLIRITAQQNQEFEQELKVLKKSVKVNLKRRHEHEPSGLELEVEENALHSKTAGLSDKEVMELELTELRDRLDGELLLNKTCKKQADWFLNKYSKEAVNWYLWGSLDVLFASNKTLTRSREQHAKNPPKKGGAAFIDID